jgi:ribosomal protein L16 Arg81 hydroxylase
MTGRLSSFVDLLTPVRPELFFKRHWENQPLHVRRSARDYYAELLTNRDVEAAISSGGLRYPAIQLARDGRFFAPEAFTRNIRSGGDMFTGVPDLERIRAEYRSGATISLPGLHRTCKPLGELAAAIEAEFDHPVHTNVYVTPANATGFTPHYDTHEVFVLQIAGSKQWRIHAPPLPLPHRSQPFDPRSWAPSVTLFELELAPGDLLYLPRGFVHTTTTADRPSVHVTLGITVYTWVDLLTEWVQASRYNRSFRHALPPGFAGHEAIRQSLGDRLRLMIAELQSITDYDKFLDSFSCRVRSARVELRADFSTDVTNTEPREQRSSG